jgi:hypothetical protein
VIFPPGTTFPGGFPTFPDNNVSGGNVNIDFGGLFPEGGLFPRDDPPFVIENLPDAPDIDPEFTGPDPETPGGLLPGGSVGDDPLSGTINEELLEILQNGFPEDPFNTTLQDELLKSIRGESSPEKDSFQRAIEAELLGMIERGGGLDQDLIDRRTESLREGLDRQASSQLDRADAELAARGLVGLPGSPQGAQGTAIAGIEQDITEQFRGGFRDIVSDEQALASQRLMDSIGIGANISIANRNIEMESKAQGFREAAQLAIANGQMQQAAMFDSIAAATDRQRLLHDVAIDQLDRNIAWNMFLAEFGLERDIALNSLNTSQLTHMIQVMALLLQAGGITAGGAV